MNTPPSALDFRGLAKVFKLGPWHRAHRALTDVTLSVAAGEIFGYLGPNGAGKTTTLKLLFGLVRMDKGEIRVLGKPHTDRSWRARTGYLPEHPYLYDSLTPREYLAYSARLSGMSSRGLSARVDATLDLVGLGEARDRLIRTFSKGMVQRAGIAQALVGDPELVILDEPMSGLDPIGRALIRRLMLDLKKQGKTVFFSTHILGDAEILCDRVAILRAGRVVSQGTLSEILQVDITHMEVICTGVSAGVVEGIDGVRVTSIAGSRLNLEIPNEVFGRAIAAIETAGGRVVSAQPERKTLEEVFLDEVQGASSAPAGKAASWEA